jgi:hypothetical protein
MARKRPLQRPYHSARIQKPLRQRSHRRSRQGQDATLTRTPTTRTGRRRFQIPTNQEQYDRVANSLTGVDRHYIRREHTKLAARRLWATNPWAGDVWASYLHGAIESLPDRPSYFITLFDSRFDVGEFELRYQGTSSLRYLLADRLPDIVRLTRARLAGLSYLLQLDLAFHRLGRNYHRTICLHWHGVVWDSRRRVTTALKSFPPGFGGAKGGQKKCVFDLAPALRYIAKDTRAQYVTIPGRFDDSPTYHYREQMTRQHLLIQQQIFYEWAKPELCIGSGTGLEVLREAIRRAALKGYVGYEGKRLG